MNQLFVVNLNKYDINIISMHCLFEFESFQPDILCDIKAFNILLILLGQTSEVLSKAHKFITKTITKKIAVKYFN